MKKSFKTLLSFSIFCWILPITLLAESKNYKPLTNISELEQYIPDGSSTKGIGLIVNQTVTILLIAAVVLAVIMIIFGGFQYMTSADSGARKDAAKKRIRSSVWGLLIAFSSILILTTINPGIVNINLGFSKLEDAPETNNSFLSGRLFSDIPSSTPSPTTPNIPTGTGFVPGGPGISIGGGTAHLDTDGSPGTYRVVEDPTCSGSSCFVIGSTLYRTVGATHLSNAGRPGNWWGVVTDNGKTSGQPIINSDGTLTGTLSIGAGVINGDTQPFVALSLEQLQAARSHNPSFGLGDKVWLTANGVTIEAIYADNAGPRGLNYSEISPAAASALGLDYRVEEGTSNYINGSVTISLPVARSATPANYVENLNQRTSIVGYLIDWSNPSARISKYFTVRDVTKGQTRRIPTDPTIQRDILIMAQELDRVREAWGTDIQFTSWYRPPEINREVGGAPQSKHMSGIAVDIAPAPSPIRNKGLKDFQQWLLQNWSGGVGIYNSWVHIDMRNGGYLSGRPASTTW